MTDPRLRCRQVGLCELGFYNGVTAPDVHDDQPPDSEIVRRELGRLTARAEVRGG